MIQSVLNLAAYTIWSMVKPFPQCYENHFMLKSPIEGEDYWDRWLVAIDILATN